jgi:hypothetical protein
MARIAEIMQKALPYVTDTCHISLLLIRMIYIPAFTVRRNKKGEPKLPSSNGNA